MMGSAFSFAHTDKRFGQFTPNILWLVRYCLKLTKLSLPKWETIQKFRVVTETISSLLHENRYTVAIPISTATRK
jgi:hypothetical protein